MRKFKAMKNQIETNSNDTNNELLLLLFKETVKRIYSLNFIYLQDNHLTYNVNTRALGGSFIFPNETYTRYSPRSKCLNGPEAVILAGQMSMLSAYLNLYHHSDLCEKPFFYHKAPLEEIKKQINKTFENLITINGDFSFHKPLYNNKNGINRCNIKMEELRPTSKGIRLKYSGSIGNNKEFKFSTTLFMINENIHNDT